MTRAEINAEVLNNLLQLDKVKKERGSTLSTRINTWINWAQAQIADWHTYEEMRKTYTGATVDGQKRYGFPTNMKDIYSLTLQDGASSRKLIYVYPREFDQKVPRPEQTTEGRSTYYVDYGVNFEAYRIPDKAYDLTLRCSIYPTDITSDSSSSALLRKDALIVAVTMMFALIALYDSAGAKYWRDEVAAPLFQSSLTSDHSAEDWVPVARGFDTLLERVGEYYSNPLVRTMP